MEGASLFLFLLLSVFPNIEFMLLSSGGSSAFQGRTQRIVILSVPRSSVYSFCVAPNSARHPLSKSARRLAMNRGIKIITQTQQGPTQRCSKTRWQPTSHAETLRATALKLSRPQANATSIRGKTLTPSTRERFFPVPQWQARPRESWRVSLPPPPTFGELHSPWNALPPMRAAPAAMSASIGAPSGSETLPDALPAMASVSSRYDLCAPSGRSPECLHGHPFVHNAAVQYTTRRSSFVEDKLTRRDRWTLTMWTAVNEMKCVSVHAYLHGTRECKH